MGGGGGGGYAVMVGGANGDGAWRGLITIVELIDPRPYNFQPAVYGRLIYSVIYVMDRLLSEANPDLRLPPPPELRGVEGTCMKEERGSVEDDVAGNIR